MHYLFFTLFAFATLGFVVPSPSSELAARGADPSTLPWPAVPNYPAERESEFVKAELVEHMDVQRNIASAAAAPVTFKDCLKVPVCMAAKRTFDICINRGSTVTACFCHTGAPWTTVVAQCAACIAKFLPKTPTSPSPATFSSSTLARAKGFCGTYGSSADILLLTGAQLTKQYKSPVQMFNITALL